MRKSLPARALSGFSALALATGVCYLAWQWWETGAVEGKKAWEEGRVVALARDGSRVEGGYKPAETAPALPLPQPAPAPEPEPAPQSSPAHPPPPLPEPILSAEGALSPAPVVDLTEETEEGSLPIISRGGNKPWQHYARPFRQAGQSPLIAVVVTGLGLNKNVTEATFRLPPDMSLSFTPYARDGMMWVGAARARGFETLGDLPLEPEGFPLNDPGPLALLKANLPEENARRLRAVMGRTAGSIGLVIPADETYSSGTGNVTAFGEQLAPRGLLVLAPPLEGVDTWQRMLSASSLPFLQADMLLAAGDTAENIARQLAEAEALALRRGTAIIVVKSNSLNINELMRWAEGLSQRGFQLAPISALARMRFS